MIYKNRFFFIFIIVFAIFVGFIIGVIFQLNYPGKDYKFLGNIGGRKISAGYFSLKEN